MTDRAVPVGAPTRRTAGPAVVALPAPAPTPWRARMEAVPDRARLAAFFGRLAVKEHLAPGLHVRPLVAELFLTENCNLACISCGCWRDTTRGELSTDEWRGVIDQLAAAGILKANFTGGEPLLRRDAAALMAHARDAGIRDLHLNTNGILLDEQRLAEVLAAGIRSFNISVDGATAAVHDRIRGRDGAFDLTVQRIRDLVAERDRLGLRVRMNFTVMHDNVGQLADIAELAAELRVRLYLNLATDTTFLFRAEGVDGLARIDREELRTAMARLEQVARRDRRWLPRYADLRYVRRHFTERIQRELPCAESQLKLMVHSRGEVGGCWGEDPSANVRESSVRDVVDSVAYRSQHERLFRKDCVGCGSNYSLNLRWRPRSYWDDLQWRLGRRSLSDG